MLTLFPNYFKVLTTNQFLKYLSKICIIGEDSPSPGIGESLIPGITIGDGDLNTLIIPASEYNKLLKENVTKEYKKCAEDQVLDVNREAAKIAKKYDLEEKMDKFTIMASNLPL